MKVDNAQLRAEKAQNLNKTIVFEKNVKSIEFGRTVLPNDREINFKTKIKEREGRAAMRLRLRVQAYFRG